jgi:DNA-binding GntR family transcriptional regulator
MKTYKTKSAIANKVEALGLTFKESVRDSVVNGAFDSAVPKFQRVQKRAMQDVVYEALKDVIIKGQIAPGTKLEINELAKNFGTSPMPIREALSRLVESGVLVTEPNKSVSVPLLQPDDLVELVRIRMVIEGMAGIWAAEHITHEELELMETYCDEMSECVRRKDKSGAAEANQKVHFAIYVAARSKKLISLIEKLWMQNGPYLGLLSWDVFVAGDGFHRNMLKELRNRNGFAVQRLIETDLFDALSSLLGVSLPDEIRPTLYFAKNRRED